jgi:FixJ family two-component response regulator
MPFDHVDARWRYLVCKPLGRRGAFRVLSAGFREEDEMDKLTATVFLVDDDARVLKSITRLLQSEGWTTAAYCSAAEFLAQHDPAVPGCLVLDLAMPDMTGLGLQSALQDLGQCRPIVFLSGHAAIPACASAMKSGAVDFLTKPVEADALLDAVQRASELDIRQRAEADKLHRLNQRISSLTVRERQVLDGVVAGMLNKQIANQLGIVEKTVKVHRAHAVSKMGARSTAELVRMVHPLIDKPGIGASA